VCTVYCYYRIDATPYNLFRYVILNTLYKGDRKNNNNVYCMDGVLFGTLTGSQLVKKLPAFYGTRRFIAALTRARRLPLS
jgi:hypothetical protein